MHKGVRVLYYYRRRPVVGRCATAVSDRWSIQLLTTCVCAGLYALQGNFVVAGSYPTVGDLVIVFVCWSQYLVASPIHAHCEQAHISSVPVPVFYACRVMS